MENKFGKLLEKAANTGKEIADKYEKTKNAVVEVIDQNDDGTFNMKDVASIVDTVGNAAKTVAASAKENAEEMSKEMERRQLLPIFKDDLSSPGFSMTKLVRITTVDKKRAESEVCKGAIGYTSDLKDMKVVNLFKDHVDEFGYTFLPTVEEGMYYSDPTDSDVYISLDRYFNDMKLKRLNELQKIAQDLGATHFRVSYIDQATSSTNQEIKADAKGKVKAKGDAGVKAEHSRSRTDKNAFKYSAENSFPGHAPRMPKLQYLKHDESIKSLVDLRLDESSPTQHQVVVVQLSSSSGIKQKDAVKIDAALKVLKMSGGATIVSEAKNEESQYFEFEVDFE